jgi:CDGSH-type Zn-finger protein
MQPKIKINRGGSYTVTGNIPLVDKEIVGDDDGASTAYKVTKKHPVQETYNLCRCGHSKNKPFCDGSHAQVDWDSEETASTAAFEDLVDQTVDGEKITLHDATCYCASARFCHPNGGTWSMVQNAHSDKETAAAIKQVCACPSGRLVAIDNATGQPIEINTEVEIGATTDAPAGNVIAPYHVTGGVEIESADGQVYAKRNRVTLCRCGKSVNKPFCDGSHLS